MPERNDSARLTRRRFVGGVGSAGAAALLAGCSNDSGGSSDGSGSGGSAQSTDDETSTPISADITLSGWAANNEESALLQNLVSEFESSHDGISVDYNPIQSEYKQKIKTQLGAGNAPDAFYVDSSYFPSFADAGVLLSMESIANSESFNIEDFFQPLLDAFRFDGTLYGIPKDFSTLGLFHNTAMFEEASVEPPETWSDLEDALSALKDNVSDESFQAPMIEYANGRSWWAFLYQNGGQVLSDDGSEAVFASDAGVEALEYLVGLKQDGLLAVPSDLGAGWHGAALASREVGVAILGPWGLPFVEEYEDDPSINEDVDVAHLPTPSDGQKATIAYTVSYSASAQTDSPAATRELISSLTNDEGMASWARKGLALSARKSHADLEYYQNHPRRKTLLEAGEWSHPFSFGPNSEAIVNRVRPQLEAAILGEKSPSDALSTAQESINSEVL
ncbi:ABC transporter substrate-binding protein [Haloarcula sp. JP-L23]|uniref:ABC transporter substrate-binding protein n=1 Tax=Haloarcula sp. JP-L23 TaxID=2716717 RepID=UPI00140F3853|nr:ABC transporter substrate-binding protein [Haloarcula sp. JP-L23]